MTVRLLLCLLGLSLTACATLHPRAPSPVPLAEPVDLERFQGDWYVIAHIPTDRDRESHNAIEHYAVNDDGSIAMTYTNRLGGFDGKPKKMTPTGYPVEGSGNALWGIRFQIPGTSIPWPFRYEYRLGHVAPDYSAMIVARSKLDYLWLFARKPQMSDADYARYTQMIAEWGYDIDKLVRVPQRWP
jgi:apolipoprotein D and lipocalin family protein